MSTRMWGGVIVIVVSAVALTAAVTSSASGQAAPTDGPAHHRRLGIRHGQHDTR